MRFGDDRSKAPAAKMSPHLRDETERAGTIAAFGNLYERVVTRRGEHTRRRFIIQVSCGLIAERDDWQRSGVCLRVADAEDVIELTGADERINLRHLCFQLIAITFDQAPRN